MDCILRKWRLSDAKDLAAALNNEKILNNLRDGLPFPYTEQDARDYISAMSSADENDTFAYAITIDDRAVGSIGAFRQSNIHRQTAELGYYLAEEYWGHGIMTKAIRQLCDIVFDTTDILRIYAEPFAYNTGSRRALEKAGFRYEGTMKNNAVKNGKVLDMVLYSVTRTMEPYPVRRLNSEEIPAALELSWRVFQEFEAPEYSPEGVAVFRASLDDPERNRQMDFYGAFAGEKLVGVLSMRAPQHIGDFLWKQPTTAEELARSCSKLCAGIIPGRSLPSIPLPMRWRSIGIWALSPRIRSSLQMDCAIRPCGLRRLRSCN